MWSQLVSIALALCSLSLVTAQRCVDQVHHEQPALNGRVDYAACGRSVCATDGYCYRLFHNICYLNAYNVRLLFAGQRALVQADIRHCLPEPRWLDYNTPYDPRLLASPYVNANKGYAGAYETPYLYESVDPEPSYSRSYDPYLYYKAQDTYSPTNGFYYRNMREYLTQRQPKPSTSYRKPKAKCSTTASPITASTTTVSTTPIPTTTASTAALSTLAASTTTASTTTPSTTSTTTASTTTPSTTSTTTASTTTPSTTSTTTASTTTQSTTTTAIASTTTPSTTSTAIASTTTASTTTPSTTTTTTTSTTSTTPESTTTASTTTVSTTASTTIPSTTIPSTTTPSTTTPSTTTVPTTTASTTPSTTITSTPPTTVTVDLLGSAADVAQSSTLSTTHSPTISSTTQSTTTTTATSPQTTSPSSSSVTAVSTSSTPPATTASTAAPTTASIDLDDNTLVSLVFTMPNGRVFRLSMASQITNPTTGNKTCAEETQLELRYRGLSEPLKFTGCLYNNSTRNGTNYSTTTTSRPTPKPYYSPSRLIDYRPVGYLYSITYGSAYEAPYGSGPVPQYRAGPGPRHGNTRLKVHASASASANVPYYD
ncbi:cell wall protein DAN4 [Drosophila mojavensis]|uniref:cell wall protein DAN4 n=1 Tax=Drosophila mojavensis TaxID=7230 RepID=UPI0013EE7CEB|nr:cell wall protein DAN4 [Drosophila mojavensis]